MGETVKNRIGYCSSLIVLMLALSMFIGCKQSGGSVTSAEVAPPAAVKADKTADTGKNEYMDGLVGLENNKLDQAAEFFRNMSRNDPRNAAPVFYTSLAYMKSGDYRRQLDLLHGYKSSNDPWAGAMMRRFAEICEIRESARIVDNYIGAVQAGQKIVPSHSALVIFPFANPSADKTVVPLKRALPALLSDDLQKIEFVRVVNPALVQAYSRKQTMFSQERPDYKTALTIARLFGAGHALTGEIHPGGKVKINLISSSTKETVHTYTASHPMSSFYKAEKDLLFFILKTLSIARDDPGGKETCRKYPGLCDVSVENFQAVSFFGQGLEHLYSGNYARAGEDFGKAASQDGRFALAREYADTAQVLESLGKSR